MRLSSLFKHFRYRTRYITIPAEVADHPRSPLRGVTRGRFTIYFVLEDGSVVDPSSWEVVDRVQMSSVRISRFAILLVYVS